MIFSHNVFKSRLLLLSQNASASGKGLTRPIKQHMLLIFRYIVVNPGPTLTDLNIDTLHHKRAGANIRTRNEPRNQLSLRKRYKLTFV